MDRVDLVLGEIAGSLRDGKQVKLPDVGVLRGKKSAKWLTRPQERVHFGRTPGKAVEVVVAKLEKSVELSRGEPYEVK